MTRGYFRVTGARSGESRAIWRARIRDCRLKKRSFADWPPSAGLLVRRNPGQHPTQSIRSRSELQQSLQILRGDTAAFLRLSRALEAPQCLVSRASYVLIVGFIEVRLRCTTSRKQRSRQNRNFGGIPQSGSPYAIHRLFKLSVLAN